MGAKENEGWSVEANVGPCWEVEPFTGDAEQIAQIARPELVKPLAELLHTLANIRRVRASFGRTTLNVIAAVEELEADAAAIEKACEKLWRDA